MSTLLLRLAAPLQAWGIESKFDTRGTGREPSKSGVLGMLAAALGISREDSESLIELNRLRFGVRVDREGQLLRDFHMAHGISKKYIEKPYADIYDIYDIYVHMDDPAYNGKIESYLTYRYYLSDAVFLCGLEAPERERLEEYAYRLQHPAYPLFLGRRSCPPTLPLVLGIRDTELLTALQAEPPLVPVRDGQRILIEADAHDATAAMVRDVPLSFSQKRREFAYRRVREERITNKQQTEHDPLAEVEADYVSDTNGA